MGLRKSPTHHPSAKPPPLFRRLSKRSSQTPPPAPTPTPTPTPPQPFQTSLSSLHRSKSLNPASTASSHHPTTAHPLNPDNPIQNAHLIPQISLPTNPSTRSTPAPLHPAHNPNHPPLISHVSLPINPHPTHPPLRTPHNPNNPSHQYPYSYTPTSPPNTSPATHPIPPRAQVKPPLVQADRVRSPHDATQRLSPAQRHFLGLDRADAAEQNALVRKKSLSPAIPGYQQVGQSAYGKAMNRRKALLIGIGYQGHKVLEELPGCTNDVREMFWLLTSELFGFKEGDVKILSDELGSLGGVSVEMPTRFNILRDLKWLTDDIGSGDSVVFFFAGHGDYMEDVSGDEVETGFDQCIMPVDFMPPPKHGHLVPYKGVSPILDDTIYERLVRAVPSGAKVTAIVDACRSGTVCDLPVVYDFEGRPRYRNGGTTPRESRSPHKSAGGVVLFSGSADHQLSVDMTVARGGPDGGLLSFGVMTRSFVDAVREMARDRDAEIYDGLENWSYGQLFERIKDLVRERTMEFVPHGFEVQEPQFSSSHLDVWQQPFSM